MGARLCTWVEKEITKYGGSVVEFVGDAGQLYFDNKDNAAKFADLLQQEVRSNEKQGGTPDYSKYKFAIRIGLLTVDEDNMLYKHGEVYYGYPVYEVEHLESHCATSMIRTNNEELVKKFADNTVPMYQSDCFEKECKHKTCS